MKVTELRIGNYLTVLGNTVEVKGIHKPKGFAEYLICTDEFIEIKRFQFKPILLTEEWLLKFDFTKEDQWYRIYVNNFIISLNYSYLGWAGKLEWVATKKEIQLPICPSEVHQLQNLYFALTGEELTIKN